MATNNSKNKRRFSVFKNERKKSKEHCDVVRKKNFHLETYFYTIAHLVMNASLHYMDYKTR